MKLSSSCFRAKPPGLTHHLGQSNDQSVMQLPNQQVEKVLGTAKTGGSHSWLSPKAQTHDTMDTGLQDNEDP